MITGIGAPVATAITGFVASGLNMLVALGIWHATGDQVATVNTFILAGVGVIAALRAGAQHGGTLTATPNGVDAAG